jgi:hypothetical protein
MTFNPLLVKTRNEGWGGTFHNITPYMKYPLGYSTYMIYCIRKGVID